MCARAACARPPSPPPPHWSQVKAVTYLSILVILAVCASIADHRMTEGLVDCLWSLCEEM